MSVSEKGECDGIGHQRRNRVANADQVFVFVVSRAVDELYVRKFVDLQRTLRKFTEPVEIFGSELVASPERGESCRSVEFGQVHQSADCLVVVAADEKFSQRA